MCRKKKTRFCEICQKNTNRIIKLDCGCKIHDECFTAYLNFMILDVKVYNIGIKCLCKKTKKCLKHISKNNLHKTSIRHLPGILENDWKRIRRA